MTESVQQQSESEVRIRALADTDISDIVAIDEKITGQYRPDIWEQRVTYYFRRDPEASAVAEVDGKVVGFMLAEVRSGEFGLEEPCGWIESLGVDPACRGRSVGRRMAEEILRTFGERGTNRVRTLVSDDMKEIRSFFDSIGFAPEPLTTLTLDL
jgi:ribosomal protein S18 acetylase RimI-like enzyme